MAPTADVERSAEESSSVVSSEKVVKNETSWQEIVVLSAAVSEHEICRERRSK
jgi:hypothetical protein